MLSEPVFHCLMAFTCRYAVFCGGVKFLQWLLLYMAFFLWRCVSDLLLHSFWKVDEGAFSNVTGIVMKRVVFY